MVFNDEKGTFNFSAFELVEIVTIQNDLLWNLLPF